MLWALTQTNIQVSGTSPVFDWIIPMAFLIGIVAGILTCRR
jgi:hypothetical protein